MAQLPRYQRLGLQTRQPGNIDFADTREQARYAQTLSQQLDRMSEFAFKKSAEMAVERGQERVREEGALPTLEAIEAKGGPRGIAEKSAVEAANRIAVVEIETLATADMQALTIEADKTNMSMPAYQAALADINDGYKASLAVVDPVAAGVLGARLQGKTSDYNNRYSEIAFRKAKAAMAQRVNDTVSTRSKAIVDGATAPGIGSTESGIEAAVTELVQAQIDLGVGQKTANKVATSTLKVAIKENRIYQFNEAAGINEKRFLLEKYKEKPLPGVSYSENLNFVNRLEANLASEIATGQKETVDYINNNATIAMQTGAPSPDFALDEDKIFGLFGEEEGQKVIDSWENTMDLVNNVGSLSDMTAEDALSVLSQLNEEIKTSDDAEVAIGRMETFRQALVDKTTALENDAAKYVISTNKEISESLAEVQTSINAGDFALASSELAFVFDQIQTKYEQTGVPEAQRNLMPKGFASSIVTMMDNVDADVATTVFSNIGNNLGDKYANKFINELRDAGLAPEYVRSMYLQDNDRIKLELATVSRMDAKDLKENLPTDTDSEFRKIINTDRELVMYQQAYLNGADSEGLSIVDEQLEVVKKVAMWRMRNGANADTAFRSALNDIIPDYKQTVFDETGTYVVPIGISKIDVSQNLQLLKQDDALKAAFDIYGFDIPRSVTVPDFVDEAIAFTSLADYGEFVNNSTGDGLELHYDDEGTLLPTGFIIKFEDLGAVVDRVYSSFSGGQETLRLMRMAQNEGRVLSGGITGGASDYFTPSTVDADPIVSPAEGAAAEGKKYADDFNKGQ
jgi:hypothetical protein